MQKQVEGTPQDVCGYLLCLSIPEAFSQEWDNLSCGGSETSLQEVPGVSQAIAVTAKDQGLSLEKAERILPASRLRGLDMALPAWICVLSYPGAVILVSCQSLQQNPISMQ